VIQASPAIPPAEVDEASKIADSIESFLSTKAEVNEQANPVSLPAEPATETPEILTPPNSQSEVDPSAAATEPVQSISTHQTTQVAAPDAEKDEKTTSSSTPKSGYKVIQPLNDLTKPPVDLEALAKVEDDLGAAQQIVNTPSTQPGDEPLEKPAPPPTQAGQTIDPTTLAL
ncbi:MAG: hypothetical protein M3Q79_00730, partial [bacterium]|nr:hypothetical protein [bacterium]